MQRLAGRCAPRSRCEAMFAGDSRNRAKNMDIVMRASFAPAIVALFCGCGDAQIDRSATSSTNAPATNVAVVSDLFSNITAQSGVQFVHATGTNYFMPDQIGSGIAIFDFDQDGRLDLYFLQ